MKSDDDDTHQDPQSNNVAKGALALLISTSAENYR